IKSFGSSFAHSNQNIFPFRHAGLPLNLFSHCILSGSPPRRRRDGCLTACAESVPVLAATLLVVEDQVDDPRTSPCHSRSSPRQSRHDLGVIGGETLGLLLLLLVPLVGH